MLLLTSIVISIGNFIWLGFMFYWAGTNGINLFIVILTTVFVVFFYIAALIKLCNVQLFRRNATIFTVSLASVYIIYLCWAAMSSNLQSLPYRSSINTGLQIGIGALFTFITILSIAIASSDIKSSSSENKTSVGGEVVAEKIDGEAKATNE